VQVFEEEDRKKGVFVGRQFYIRDPDGTVIEFTEWDGTSKLDCCSRSCGVRCASGRNF